MENCRKTAALPAADAACVSNNSERDAVDQQRRRAAEVDTRCVSQAQNRSRAGEWVESVKSNLFSDTEETASS